ncbi:DUF7287 family protein [Halobellus limi]|uniref:Uncharacterized protein n=1 Tax=Halobellus limi TaxID=699433 RepID=A0A1H6C265_9EURY|nr:hypothetical protein [Halobellus limi]QCC48555.1 hypothetical protein DV707_13300 [Halobellus limi]SEG67051.1 hypothetical protein SAMN04488133_3149 [Halobellus limi]
MSRATTAGPSGFRAGRERDGGGNDGSDGDRRAQTTIDFAIGIGLFLLVVAFVVAFVPTIFTPFESAEGPQTADRIGTSLAADRLGDPGEPFVLNRTCTEGFFAQLDGDGPAPSGCQFNTSATTTRALFTLDETRNANVSIRTLDDGDVETLDGTRLSAGPSLPETRSVTSARRVVSIEGEPYQLLVRVW